MKTIIANFSANFTLPECFSSGTDVFFDIETTGLNWRNSHLYLIGAAVYHPETENFEIIQWFADEPAGETDLLDAFAEFLRPYKRLIHYNGDTFDLPYLRNKYSFYRRPVLTETMETLDLYRNFRPLRRLFRIPSMKQKDLEVFAGLQRNDTFSGGDLIQVYKDYLSCGARSLLEDLYLHNKEDLTGLIHLLSIYGFFSLFTGAFHISKIKVSDDLLTLMLLPDSGGLCPIQAELAHARIFSDRKCLTIEVPCRKQEMKFFFDNYRDYYYFPLEDTAIHKSVGIYADPQHREKAKASNCYQRRTGCFFWQPSEIITPAFREDFRSTDFYFEWNDSLTFEDSRMNRYANELFQIFCQAKETVKL